MIRIAITKTTSGKYPKYREWLLRWKHDLEILDLEKNVDPVTSLSSCHGFLLPGGGDVDPAHYGLPDMRSLCTIDADRDRLEFTLIEKALTLRLPVLGICRGLQIVNVFLGGSLVPDLPLDNKLRHSKSNDRDQMHIIQIRKNSRLFRFSNVNTGVVNSSHHQAVDNIAPDLHVTANTIDNVTEAMEWRNPSGKSYLILVQWHPERMEEQENSLSKGLAVDFLRATGEYAGSH